MLPGTTPDDLQALLNARLAKSKAERGVVPAAPFAPPPRDGASAETSLPPPAPADAASSKLERLGTWSEAPEVAQQDVSTFSWSNDIPVSQHSGRALIRACTREMPEPLDQLAQPSDDQDATWHPLPLGRLMSNRSRSAHSHWRKGAPQTVAISLQRSPQSHEEGHGVVGTKQCEGQHEHERSTSVPPIPVGTVVLAAVRFKRSVSASRRKVKELDDSQKVADKQADATPNAATGAVQEDDDAVEEGTRLPLTTVVLAAVRFARPLTVSGRRMRRVVPEEKDLARDVRRQLRLVVAGLMGSGKSTLCRMLAHLLGGHWVNQDEFSHKGKAAKRAFLEEIEAESRDRRIPVLIVDKINTLRQHRREILHAMDHGVSGDIVFVQMSHPDDSPGRLDNMVKLCIERIQGRGEGHRTLLASNPKVRSILRMTAGGAEPMQPDELQRLSACITVDVTQPPAKAAMQVLADLDVHHLLGRLCLNDLVTHDRLSEALEVAQGAERQLASSGGHAGSVSLGKVVANTVMPAAPRKRAAPVWYWTVDFDSEAVATMRALWQVSAVHALQLEPAADVHVTLLYLGGAHSDKEILRRYPTLQKEGGTNKVKHLRETLMSMEGHDLDIEISSVAWDSSIAAAEVVGLGDVCANPQAHITLAHQPGVPPRASNEMLARRAANANLATGLGPWLAQLGIADVESEVRCWCNASGATTADEIAHASSEVAKAVARNGKVSEDRVGAVRQTLKHAAPSKITEAGVSPFKAPLRLRGKVRGRLRGE